MNTKTIMLSAMLVPSLAMLAACDRNKPDMDDAATPPAAATTADMPPTDSTMPADTMPADTTPAPADDMQGDAMSADNSGMTGGDKTFAEMDKNKDGSVSKDELDSSDMLSQHFSVADANGDGKLSEDEIAKHRADMAAAPAQ